jgi:decaprenylphospho-beta-D-erythro-pentofuranosid-2-ulose 2-reductase
MSNATRGAPVAILGATSAIGKEIADVLASRGRNVLLFARNERESAVVAASLVERHGITAVTKKLDVLSFDEDLLRRDLTSHGPIGGVILCIGYLGDNEKAFSDPDEAARIMDTNFTACARALDVAASVLDGGFVCALSSVAGDRPRRKVRTYGLAKAALNDYLAQLRARLSHKGVRVITIKLGSVDTRMISHRRRHPFVISASDAASQIVEAAEHSDGVVYLPFSWKVIMAVMKLVPESIYQRL